MRTVLAAVYVFLKTVTSYPTRLYNKIKYKDQKMGYDLNYKKLNKMTSRMLKILGIEVKLEGNCDLEEKPFLYVGNHRSDFDSLILIAYTKRPIVFIGKSEIKKMPFIGKWFTDIGCIFIDREDAKASMAAIVEGIKRLKNGYSLVIFPEGGRTREEGIREFKPGSMKLATKSGVDIVPITFYNTEECYERYHKLKPAKVKMAVGEPINQEKEGLKSTTEIARYVQCLIENNYKEMAGIDTNENH